jgi:hypothetical protein
MGKNLILEPLGGGHGPVAPPLDPPLSRTNNQRCIEHNVAILGLTENLASSDQQEQWLIKEYINILR